MMFMSVAIKNVMFTLCLWMLLPSRTRKMSRNNINESRSVSSASCNSITSDADESLENGLDELSLGSKGSRPSSTQSRTSKAKRIRFYHNGNKFFNGVVVPVASERYRSFESLTTELTSLLMKSVTLPSGVRTIYSMDGRKVCNLNINLLGECSAFMLSLCFEYSWE